MGAKFSRAIGVGGEAMQDLRTFELPGLVSEAFVHDRTNEFRLLAGPIGSGKTNTIIFDNLRQAAAMPICQDGVRRFRAVMMRKSYQDLWKTTIKTWWDLWYPKEVGDWQGSEGRRASHTLRWRMPGGEILQFEFWFLAIQDMTVEQATKGIEMTTANLNEANELTSDVPTYLLGRVLQKRYPPPSQLPEDAREMRDGNLVSKHFAGISGDMNFPDIDNWTYKDFEAHPKPGYKLFSQPGGRSPNAENRKYVSRQDYERLAEINAHKPWWVMSMVDAKWAPRRDGEPVFQNYDDRRHCVEEIRPDPDLPIRLSFDQDVLGPAMLVSQLTYIGQYRAIAEFVPEHRMGPTQFGHYCAGFLKSNFDGLRVASATCDLAGFKNADAEWGDLSWAQTVGNQLRLELQPAPTNEFQARFDAVDQLLTYFPDGQPALLVSARGCPVLRSGFNSNYMFKTKGEGDEKEIDRRPVGNRAKDIHDCLQYDLLDAFGLDGVIHGEPGGDYRIGGGALGELMPSRGPRGGRQPETEFDVFDC